MIPFVLWLMSSSGDNYRRCSWKVSPLLLSFTEAAEQDVCPHVLLQFPSSWVTLTHQWAVLGQRLCLSQLLSLQALPCVPFTRQEAVFPPGRSYRGIRFPSVQWQRALPKLPKKSVIRLDWKERNKIRSCHGPHWTLLFLRGREDSPDGAGLVAGLTRPSASIRGRLSVWWEQKQFPSKVHKSNGYFKMSEEREVHLCISIINRILTFKITIPAIVLSRRSKPPSF